jgi:hypothetical protein
MSDKSKKGDVDITKTEVVEGKVNSFLDTYKYVLIAVGVAILVAGDHVDHCRYGSFQQS